jgi:N-acetylneuraminic acid mutarotase
MSLHFNKNICYVFSVVCVFVSWQATAQSWVQIADFPGTERDDGVSFQINYKAYCGTGLTPWFAATADFYAFDFVSESWSAIAPMPANTERQYACGFASSTRGYVFGGLNDTTFLNDLWQYDPIQNTWTQKSPLPALGRSGAACFVINDTAYIIGGRTANAIATAEVWAYNMAADSWEQKNNLPLGARWRASGTSMYAIGYLVFGRDENGQDYPSLLQYAPGLDSWASFPAFPAMGRTYATLQPVGGELVVFGGIDSVGNSYNDLWRYRNLPMLWEQRTPLPDLGRRGGMSFSLNSIFYYTTGIDQNNTRLKETWKCVYPTAITENHKNEQFIIFPNSATTTIQIIQPNNTTLTNYSYSIRNALGNQVIARQTISNNTPIDISVLTSGIYFIDINNDDKVEVLKFIKD